MSRAGSSLQQVERSDAPRRQPPQPWLSSAGPPAGPASGRAMPSRSSARARAGRHGTSWRTSPTRRPVRSGSRWSGGRAGDRAVRSFRPDQLYASSARPGHDPSLADAPGFLSADGLDHGPPWHPDANHYAARLRPFVSGDLDELAAIHAEESFWWYPLRSAMNKEETGAFLERVRARYESDGFGIEALIERASGTMIGGRASPCRTSCPRSFPPSRWGGACRGRIEGGAWRPRRARPRWSSGSPRAGWTDREHLRAGERRVGGGNGSSRVHPPPHHGRPPRGIGRGLGLTRERWAKRQTHG